MKIYFRAGKVSVYAVSVIRAFFLLDVIRHCAAGSVKTAQQFRSDVYIVTPEPSSSEARDFPYFLPTPLPDEKLQKPLPSKHALETTATTRRLFSSGLAAFPPFQPTALPEQYTRSTTRSSYVPTTKGPPDIIIAEFREGSSKDGKPNERMLSVKEMLSREKVAGYSATTSAPTSPTYSRISGKHNAMDVKDVWDIIRHNQDLESSTPKQGGEAVVAADVVKSLPTPPRSPEYTVETVPSISFSKDVWSSAEPSRKVLNKTLQSIGETIDQPRNIRGDSTFPKPARQVSPRERYYPAYSGQGASYSSVDNDRYELRPATGEAEDRYNPAQPYLPPHAAKPAETKRPAPPAPLPAPPVPMPPPPPPQPYMNAPSITYDSVPSYSPPDSSPPITDTSGPPSDSYSYQPPDDSGPPSASFTAPSDDHHHHHHHHDHHDDGFKFVPPQSDSDSPGDQDSYPQLIFDDDHHSHHSSHEIDYHDLHEFYHHHHVHPPLPPPTTTTTTPAPEMEDTRVNNRFSYYYLGKKLWYLPLYFSVYFIIYVGALIIKSVARHKITYPQHYKTKRSLDWKMPEKDLHTLTRFACNAILNAAERYSKKS